MMPTVAASLLKRRATAAAVRDGVAAIGRASHFSKTHL
jgi:hypothetical protein